MPSRPYTTAIIGYDTSFVHLRPFMTGSYFLQEDPSRKGGGPLNAGPLPAHLKIRGAAPGPEGSFRPLQLLWLVTTMQRLLQHIHMSWMIISRIIPCQIVTAIRDHSAWQLAR